MQELIIIGAGGFGREILAWAGDCSGRWRLKGFLDDNPAAAQDARLRAPVVGSIEGYVPQANDVFVCGVGSPKLRQAFSEKLKSRGARFASVIHPTAIVAPGAKLGEGIVLCPFALVSVDATLGEGTAVYYHSSVDHDAAVGPWTQVSAHCDITGGAVLGAGVFMGSHASVLPRVRVGDGVVIGAGAVVTRDIPAGAKVVGVPARARE